MFKVEDEFGVKVSDEDLRRHQVPRRPGAPRRLRRCRPPARPEPGGMRRVAITGIGVVSALGNSLEEFRRALAAGRSGVRPAARGQSRAAPACRWARSSHWDPGRASQGWRGGHARPRLAVRARRGRPGARGQPARPGGRRPQPHRRLLGHRHGRREHARRRLQHGLRQERIPAAAAHRRHGDEQRRGLERRGAHGACAGRSPISPPPALPPRWRSARRCAPISPGAPTSWWRAAPKRCSRQARSPPGRRCARSHPPMPPTRRRAASPSTSAAPGWCSAKAPRHSCSRRKRTRASVARQSTAFSSATATRATRRTCREPDRDGQIRAMREALDESGIAPQDIGYINAHGTATSVGDVVEAEAINTVFAGAPVRVSSTKSLHGHLLGGAGALEFAVALLALRGRPARADRVPRAARSRLRPEPRRAQGRAHRPRRAR